MLVRVIAVGIAFGVHVLLARLTGADQYGIFLYALTWVGLLLFGATLGMDNLLLRFVSAYNAKRQWGLLSGVLRFTTRCVLSACLVMGSGVSVVVWVLHTNGYIGTDLALTFVIGFFCFLPVSGLVGLRQSALRGLKHVVKAALPNTVIRPILLAAAAAVIHVVIGDSMKAPHVMAANTVCALVALVTAAAWLSRAMPDGVEEAGVEITGREWLGVSLPLLLISGMHLVLGRIDIVMIGAMLESKDVAVYGSATRIARLLTFGLAGVNAIAAPMFSELHSQGKHDELQRIVTLAARGIFICTVAAGAFLVCLGRPMLALFGSVFTAGHVPLLILLAGHAVGSLVGPVGFLMIMTGRQNQAAMILGVAAVVNIIGNAFCIPRFGLPGAAMTTAFTTMLWSLVMLAYVRCRLGIMPTVVGRSRR